MTVATTESTTLAVTGLPSLAMVKQALATGSRIWVEASEGESVLLAELEHFAETRSTDDLFTEGGLEKVKDHLGETLVIEAIEGVNNSDFAEGLGIYLVVRAVTADGEVIRLGVGAKNPVAKIIALAEDAKLPFAVAFEQSDKPTKDGYYPLHLRSRQDASGVVF